MDHPGDTEAVAEHAETLSEESPGQRHLDSTAIGERGKEALGVALGL